MQFKPASTGKPEAMSWMSWMASMRFEPAGTDKPNTTSWMTENDYYAIIATDRHVMLQTRPTNSDWMHVMPFEINIEDRGMAVFVVRGIMDALAPVPNEPDLAEAVDAVQAYLGRLCPEEDKSERDVIHAGKHYLGLAAAMGRRSVYHVRLAHIRRCMKEHADRSQSKTEL